MAELKHISSSAPAAVSERPDLRALFRSMPDRPKVSLPKDAFTADEIAKDNGITHMQAVKWLAKLTAVGKVRNLGEFRVKGDRKVCYTLV